MPGAFSFSGSSVEILDKLFEDPRPVLAKMGVHLVRRSQEAFRLQRRGTNAWPPRRIPNVAGVIRDLEKSASIKGRRFDGRPSLIDNGQLRSSISFQFVTLHKIVYGTTLPYASLHNYGGKSIVKISPTVQKNLAIVLRRERRALRRGKGSGRDVGALAFLFNAKGGGRRKSIEIKVPKRVFVDFDTLDEAKMSDFIDEWAEGQGVT